MTERIITRGEAKSQGLMRYFTGKPCKYGHVAERRVANGGCWACRAEVLKEQIISGDNAQRKRAFHIANRERELARKRAYYIANRERELARNASRDRSGRHQLAARKAYLIEWHNAHPEKTRAYHGSRRAREKAADGAHTDVDIQRIYTAQRGKCACCKAKVGDDYQIDHIQPLSKGGSNFAANLQILCPSCNRQKSARDPIEHMQSLGLLL